MDFSNIPDLIRDNLLLLIGGVAVIVVQIILRRGKKSEKTQQDIVHSLLAEANLNHAAVEVFLKRSDPKRLTIASWQRNKNKLDFLEQPLQTVLTDAFMLADEFNQQMSVAKKYKSNSYLATFNTKRLKEMLDKGREGLEEWLLKNVGRKERPPIKYPSVIDGLFGG